MRSRDWAQSLWAYPGFVDICVLRILRCREAKEAVETLQFFLGPAGPTPRFSFETAKTSPLTLT